MRALMVVLAACVVAAGVVLAVRWRADDDEFDRRGAREFTQEALERAGLEQVEVEEEVEATRYRPRTFPPDDPPLSVFRTTSQVEGGTVELLVHPASGRAVYLRDVATDGSPLMSDDQYRRLRDFAWDDEAEEARRRRGVGSAATAALVLAAAGTVAVGRREQGTMAP